jgi:acid phosphatase family membrane protein YuiD
MKPRKEIDPTAPGESILRAFRRDHRRLGLGSSGNDPSSVAAIVMGMTTIVAFANGKRTAALFVSTVGGVLQSFNGKSVKQMTVSDALAWYRRQIASNWFSERVDNDKGWLLLLGMAEGLAARQIGNRAKK